MCGSPTCASLSNLMQLPFNKVPYSINYRYAGHYRTLASAVKHFSVVSMIANIHVGCGVWRWCVASTVILSSGFRGCSAWRYSVSRYYRLATSREHGQWNYTHSRDPPPRAFAKFCYCTWVIKNKSALRNIAFLVHVTGMGQGVSGGKCLQFGWSCFLRLKGSMSAELSYQQLKTAHEARLSVSHPPWYQE